MKKKLFGLFALLAVFSLASCTSGQQIDDGVREDVKLTEENKNLYNVNFNSDINSTKIEYADPAYSFYIADNTVNSLFKYSYNLEGVLSSYTTVTKNLYVNSLYFYSTPASDAIDYKLINDVEQANLLVAIYNEENGIKSLNIDFGFDVDYKANWIKSISTEKVYHALADEDATNVSLNAVYMPVYMVRKNGSQSLVRKYVFTPVYITITATVGGVEKEVMIDENGEYIYSNSTIASIKSVDLSGKFTADPRYPNALMQE